MRFAMNKDNYITSIIICNPEQQKELETALGVELLDAEAERLEVGDHFNGTCWTRNYNGEEIPVTDSVFAPPPSMEERVAAVEEAVEMLCMPDVE